MNAGPLYLSEAQAAMAVGGSRKDIFARTIAAPGQTPLVPYHVEGIHGRAYNLVNLIECFDLSIQWALCALCGLPVAEDDSITITKANGGAMNFPPKAVYPGPPEE